MKRYAFTMIELVFVIVVLGILASVAIPKLAATRDDAHVSKARSTIAAVRSGIVNERQTRLFRGEIAFINRLDAGVAANTEGVLIFDNNGTDDNTILSYGVVTADQSGGWLKTGGNTYDFNLQGTTETFTYDPATGRFDCNRANQLCKDLTD